MGNGDENEAMDALLGEGKYDKPEDQTLLPLDILNDIKNAAHVALLKIPDGKTPLQNFSTIHQDINESFIKFVDRLKETIERQIDNPEAQEELLWKMAATNANEETKKIIRVLPQDPEPSIRQIVEACTKR